MNILEQLENHFSIICQWAELQETTILKNGIPLTENQKIDAHLVGVKNIDQVRLMKVAQIPRPDFPELQEAIDTVGLLTESTIGISFRYGIYIKEDHWERRNIVVHELSHTMQYERLGGFEAFLKQYLMECITLGYRNSALEMEAVNIEQKICS